MSVKLILLQDVEELGLAGEEVHVAPGYARNFLVPRKLAAVATKAALKQIEANREKIEAQRQQELAAAQELAEKLAALNVVITMQASDDSHLFGSVTDRMIAEAIEKLGFKISHQRIHLEAQLRTLGEFQIPVKLHPKVTTNVKVTIARA